MRSRHVTGARFNCNICGMGFTSKTKYESHLKTSHFEEKKQQQSAFMCSECEKRPFVCKMCNQRFKVLEVLRRHMQTHTKERNFSCDKCKKTFKTRRELTQHRAIHGKRNLICEMCGKTFSTPQYLKKHLKIHQQETGEFFSCEHCGDIFKNKQRLQTHQRIHEGERKLKCQLCNASFERQTHFTLHLKRHEEILKQKEYKLGKTNRDSNGNKDLHYQNGNLNAQEIDEVTKTQAPPEEATVAPASEFDIQDPSVEFVWIGSPSKTATIKKDWKLIGVVEQLELVNDSATGVETMMIAPAAAVTEKSNHVPDVPSDVSSDCLNFCMAQEIQMFSYAGSRVQFNKTNLMLALSEWFGGADGPPIVKVIANDFEQCVKKHSTILSQDQSCLPNSDMKSDQTVFWECLQTNLKPCETEAQNENARDKANLEKSKIDRMQKRPHSCKLCTKTFKKPDDVRRHLRFHKTNIKLVETCVSNTTGTPDSTTENVEDRKLSSKVTATETGVEATEVTFCLTRETQRQNAGSDPEFVEPPKAASRILSQSFSRVTELDSTLIESQKDKLQELLIVNDSTATAENMITRVYVRTCESNHVLEQSSNGYQIIFQQIMDELAKAGSKTVNDTGL
ncbi:unnamed protein product [Orchesella dallaii]|uniref:C2H2-type domain-containing protein n=1 Tax=Orchesella dallaii TaxID=48710 RepID=A0ABP1S2Q6_9HEXA